MAHALSRFEDERGRGTWSEVPSNGQQPPTLGGPIVDSANLILAENKLLRIFDQR